MDLGPALNMDEAKQKLANLKEFMPNAPSELTYEFGKFLAGRLNPQLNAMGFIMACELSIYDLQAGVDGFSGKAIQSKLVGYPATIYALLRLDIPHIAEIIFPADFATRVKEALQEIDTAT